jgi:hypothetical protein
MSADPKVLPQPTLSEAMKGNTNARKDGENSGDNIKAVSQPHGSNSAAYLVRRLKRDAPEIAEALARGEYPSARAAGIAAGIVKVATALEQILRLLPRLTQAERRRLRRELDKGGA